jgi:uncharacterized membrane protein
MFSALLIGIKKLLALALVIVFIIQTYNPQQYPILVKSFRALSNRKGKEAQQKACLLNKQK